MKYCANCEGKLIPGLKYCFNCGANIENSDTKDKKSEKKVSKNQSNKSRLDKRLFEII